MNIRLGEPGPHWAGSGSAGSGSAGHASASSGVPRQGVVGSLASSGSAWHGGARQGYGEASQVDLGLGWVGTGQASYGGGRARYGWVSPGVALFGSPSAGRGMARAAAYDSGPKCG
jgi:hypothetical protein